VYLFIHSASARGAYLINLEKGLPISAVKGVSPRVRESPGLRDPPPAVVISFLRHVHFNLK